MSPRLRNRELTQRRKYRRTISGCPAWRGDALFSMLWAAPRSASNTQGLLIAPPPPGSLGTSGGDIAGSGDNLGDIRWDIGSGSRSWSPPTETRCSDREQVRHRGWTGWTFLWRGGQRFVPEYLLLGHSLLQSLLQLAALRAPLRYEFGPLTSGLPTVARLQVGSGKKRLYDPPRPVFRSPLEVSSLSRCPRFAPALRFQGS
jgi:hypothetical protein